MNKSFFKKIEYCLNNDNGGPEIEYLIIVSVCLCIGAGLFVIGRGAKNWFNSKPKPVIDGIYLPKEGDSSEKGLLGMQNNLKAMYADK